MHVCIVDVASSPGHSQLSMLHAEKLPVFQRATLKSWEWPWNEAIVDGNSIVVVWTRISVY